MRTGFSATFPVAGYELHLELSRARAIMLLLLATLCTVLVFMPSTRLDRSMARALPQAAGMISQAAGVISSSQASTPEPTVAVAPVSTKIETNPEIDALAIMVAKQYRVSIQATRDLIAAAYREGHRIGIDPLLILAVISVESRFNPIAESDMGAMGLMQIIPAYHKDKLGRRDSVLDPFTNIRIGAHVLKEYITRGGTEVAGLQRYNGSADDATRKYSNKVLGEKSRFEQAVANQRARDRIGT